MALDFTGQVVDNLMLSKIDAPLGTYRQSDLTLAQFSANAMGTWKLCDGSSCSGSAYEALTGKSTVPNAQTDGYFFRQAKVGRALGSVEADDFKSHTHIQDAHNHIDGFAGVNGTASFGVTSVGAAGNVNGQSGVSANNHAITSATTATNQSTGGTETRPKNIATNYFIKIGY